MCGGSLVSLALLILCAGVVSAATYNLRAASTSMTMPDGRIVTMWGFADMDGSNVVTVPGPELEVVAPDTTLTINLTNQLQVPVSLNIIGQVKAQDPVWTVGLTNTIASTGSRLNGDNTARVRSFDAEAAPGGTHSYTWNNLQPGTYCYRSGTNPALQVQMGLYGGLKIDAGVGLAYAGVTYDSDVFLIFHEIDYVIHDAAAAGTYGPGGTVTSSVNYRPQYYLINGKAFTDPGSSWIAAGAPGDTILLRFVNAGLETHVPALKGMYGSLVAVDGIKRNYSKSTYSLELNAGNTQDVLISAGTDTVIPLYDARMYLSNNGSAFPGGMLAYLVVGNVAAPCVGDFDLDGDVDGADAATLIGQLAGFNLPGFAASYGNTACGTLP